MCYPFLAVNCGHPGKALRVPRKKGTRGSSSSSECGRLETGTVASILRPPGKTIRGKAKTPWLAEQRNEKKGVSENGGGAELTGRVLLEQAGEGRLAGFGSPGPVSRPVPTRGLSVTRRHRSPCCS